MTDFEKHLTQVKVRPIPTHWREEILGAAESGRPKPAPSGIVTLYLTVRGLLWPHPAAWAALATCWILTGFLCFSGPKGAALYAVTPPGMNPVDITPESYAAYLKARESFHPLQSHSEPPVFNRTEL